MAGVQVVNPEAGSLENRVSVMAAQAIDGWRQVELDGTVPGHGSDMPAAFAAGILPVELVLHGWDLAQASGQQLHISDELVAYLVVLAEGLVPGGREGVQQDPGLLARPAPELDQGGGAACGGDLACVFGEDRVLASERVVLGQPGDLIEQV